MNISTQRERIPDHSYRGNAMTYKIESVEKNQIDAGYETSKFALGVGIAMATLVGIWGSACLISALAGTGPINLIKSYFTAIIG